MLWKALPWNPGLEDSRAALPGKLSRSLAEASKKARAKAHAKANTQADANA